MDLAEDGVMARGIDSFKGGYVDLWRGGLSVATSHGD